MKRKIGEISEQESSRKIIRFHCLIDTLESWGLFCGMWFSKKFSGDITKLNKLRKSTDFYNEISADLENFLAFHEYTIEALESWFKR